MLSALPAPATTWFVRQDGGTRYSTDLPYGGCNGTADAAYPGLTSNLWWPSITYTLGAKFVDSNGNYETVTTAGTAASSAPSWPAHGSSGATTTDGSAVVTSGGAAPVNQNCAFNDVRYMYMTGAYSNEAWLMVGGDTLVIEGCAAQPVQQNPDASHCRMGPDQGGSAPYNGQVYAFCAGPMTWSCSMPPPPSGTSGAHTRILGHCAYLNNCTGPSNTYPYTTNNLTQIFGGFGTTVAYLSGSSYVDVEGLEITTHNQTVPSAHTAWSAGSYSTNQSVTYSGVVWVSLVDSNTATPGTDATKWVQASECVRLGNVTAPAAGCSTSPADDFSPNGLTTTNTTSNILLQNLYLHGFTSSAIGGPIGGPFTLNNVSLDFNPFAGWNFDDGAGAATGVTAYSISGNVITVTAPNSLFPGAAIELTNFPTSTFLNGVTLELTSATSTTMTAPFAHADASATESGDYTKLSTPDGPGSSITQSYVSMVGNGCLEQYPIANTQFPALAFWDSNSGGFGDSWSGQASIMAGFSFSADHCYIAFNGKDGALGPHTLMSYFSFTDCIEYGNQGAAGKWGLMANSTSVVQNNLLVGNQNRMTQQVPGASQNFASGCGIPGCYLTGPRGGDTFAYFSDANSSVLFAGNTVVSTSPTIFDWGCNTANNCGTTPYVFKNNILLGYMPNGGGYYPNTGQAPGLYYLGDASVTVAASYNDEWGVRNGSCPGGTGMICGDPLLTNEPAQGSWGPPESALDTFLTTSNLYPASMSQVIHAGTAVSGLTTDFFGVTRPTPPSMGAVEPAGTPPSTGTTLGNVTISGSAAVQ